MPFETTCILWRPESPEVTAGGTLRYDRAAGISLDVVGPVNIGSMILFDVAESEPITLLNVLVRNSSAPIGASRAEQRHSTASAQTMIRGVRLEHGEETLIRSIRVELDGLDDWYDTARAPAAMPHRGEWADDHAITMRWPAPPEFTATLASGDVVSLVAPRSMHDGHREFRVSIQPELVIDYAEPIALDAALRAAETFRWLIALVTCEPTRVTALKASTDLMPVCDIIREPVDPPNEHRRASDLDMAVRLYEFDFARQMPAWMELVEWLRVPITLCSPTGTRRACSPKTASSMQRAQPRRSATCSMETTGPNSASDPRPSRNS